MTLFLEIFDIYREFSVNFYTEERKYDIEYLEKANKIYLGISYLVSTLEPREVPSSFIFETKDKLLFDIVFLSNPKLDYIGTFVPETKEIRLNCIEPDTKQMFLNKDFMGIISALKDTIIVTYYMVNPS